MGVGELIINNIPGNLPEPIKEELNRILKLEKDNYGVVFAVRDSYVAMVSKFTGEHQKIKSIRSRPRERLTVVKVLSMERLPFTSENQGINESNKY